MKHVFCAILLISLFSCSSAVKRTRDSDKSLRVLLDARTISESDYSALQQALFSTNKFYIVDRSKGYSALKTEQDRQHRTEADRYDDSQKYAQWGKIYGAGAVITARSECVPNNSQLNPLYFGLHLATLDIFWKPLVCSQYIELIDTNTSEVVVSIRNDLKSNTRAGLDWDDAVDKLISEYPEVFEARKKNKILQDYEAESKREAEKQRAVSSEK